MVPLYPVFSSGVQKEHDQTQHKIANEVYAKINQIQKENGIQEKSPSLTKGMGIVSVEQALKELKDLGAI
jgi:hypothetical protein